MIEMRVWKTVLATERKGQIKIREREGERGEVTQWAGSGYYGRESKTDKEGTGKGIFEELRAAEGS
ncbi:hypothetical protein NQZ68_025585 [Dissostichus eleginoides]|nr:hypothetical protein NQZ68_025585 [Dissostichus eleginoides]